MAGSAVDAISQAVERSKQLLFPLKAEKWFALGFTVFLAHCGEASFDSAGVPNVPFGSGGPTVPRTPTGGGGTAGEFQRMFDDLVHALRADLALYITLALVGVVLTIGISIFVLWFSSRAKLMFVESVVWDRVDVGAQWTRAADLGMSLFKFRLWLMLAGALVSIVALGAGVLTGFSDFQTGNIFGPRALLGYAVLGIALFLLGFPMAIATLLLEDFVVPLMVVRNVRVGEAWRIYRTEAVSGNVGGFVLFYLLRMLLFVAIALAAVVLRCLTCCIGGLPYIGTVLLLPAFAFWRAYPLYYLEQLGLQIFPLPEPSWVAYDQWRFPR